MNKLELVLELVRCLLFLGFRCLFGLVQGLFWLLNGTYYTRRCSRNPEAYANSAHVLDIWWRRTLSLVILPNSLWDFITVHNRFDHPSVVLQDNITIYAITSSYAVFVETDRGVDVANSA